MEQTCPGLGSSGCRSCHLSEIDVVVAPANGIGAVDTTERQNVVDQDSSLLELEAEHLEWRVPGLRCRPEATVCQHREIAARHAKRCSQIVDDLDDPVGQRSDGVSDHEQRHTDLQLARAFPAAQLRTSKLYIGTIRTLYATGPQSASTVLPFRSMRTLPYTRAVTQPSSSTACAVGAFQAFRTRPAATRGEARRRPRAGRRCVPILRPHRTFRSPPSYALGTRHA